MGSDGLPVPGEGKAENFIAYGIPDVLGADRTVYAGKRTLVVGSGHSAINVALALLELQDQAPDTQVVGAAARTEFRPSAAD
jgi:thioredoxin reductase